jgi:hypothetical protein
VVLSLSLSLSLLLYTHTHTQYFLHIMSIYLINSMDLEKLIVTQLVKFHLLWNLQVLYHVHMSLPLVTVLTQMNPVHSLPPYFPKIHSNVIFQSAPSMFINMFHINQISQTPNKFMIIFQIWVLGLHLQDIESGNSSLEWTFPSSVCNMNKLKYFANSLEQHHI